MDLAFHILENHRQNWSTIIGMHYMKDGGKMGQDSDLGTCFSKVTLSTPENGLEDISQLELYLNTLIVYMKVDGL